MEISDNNLKNLDARKNRNQYYDYDVVDYDTEEQTRANKIKFGDGNNQEDTYDSQNSYNDDFKNTQNYRGDNSNDDWKQISTDDLALDKTFLSLFISYDLCSVFIVFERSIDWPTT